MRAPRVNYNCLMTEGLPAFEVVPSLKCLVLYLQGINHYIRMTSLWLSRGGRVVKEKCVDYSGYYRFVPTTGESLLQMREGKAV